MVRRKCPAYESGVPLRIVLCTQIENKGMEKDIS